MNEEKVFLVLAVVAVGVSLVASGLLYFSISNLFTKITAFVTTGEVNLTVETLAQINFTRDSVNFLSGRVNSDRSNASLNTSGAGSVSGGNWTADNGLVIENIGNVNVTLNLSGTKTAAAFIGGTNPKYRWNISSDASSCGNKSGKFAATGGALGGLEFGNIHNVNTSTVLKCFVYRFENNNDGVLIDFFLEISDDSSTGALGDVITATAYAQNPTGSG
jgi:hypothetical protein